VLPPRSQFEARAPRTLPQDTSGVYRGWRRRGAGAAWGQQEGDLVCRSAATTNWHCRQIVDRAATLPDGEGWLITNVWVMNKDASPGDSGGIYVTKTWDQFLQGWIFRAAGVHVHSSTDGTCDDSAGKCRAWYSTAQDLQDFTALVICTSINC